MKRIGNLFDITISPGNLLAAHLDIRRTSSRSRKRQAESFAGNLQANLQALHEKLAAGTWKMDQYTSFTRREGGKLREIWYDKRYEAMVVQHAIGRTLGIRLVGTMIRETYASISGRGIHQAVKHIRRHIRSYPDDSPLYICKSDFRHFYPSVDKEVLKTLLAAKIKDSRLLALVCGGIVDHSPAGLPIGNYLSPLLANFYLSGLDHLMKEKYAIKGYYRYLDDIGMIHQDKAYRKSPAAPLRHYAEDTLHLTVKENIQIFPIERYGLDFLGYVFRRHDVRLRQLVARRFRRAALIYRRNPTREHRARLSSYWGWIQPATGGKKLWFSELGKPVKQLEAANG